MPTLFVFNGYKELLIALIVPCSFISDRLQTNIPIRYMDRAISRKLSKLTLIWS